jgi:methionine synthase II (cobalamin-independent)
MAGVIDGRRSPLEPVEATAEFAVRATESTGAPRLFVSSNCELEFLPRDLARQKVVRLGEVGARLKDALA